MTADTEDFADHVLECHCGCPDFYLRRDGRITCKECDSQGDENTKRLWIWKEANK